MWTRPTDVLILIRAGARARVLGDRQDAAGDNEIIGAARAEAAEVAGAAVVAIVEVTRRPGAEGQQVLGGRGRVAAIAARPAPRDALAGDGVLAHLQLAGEQIAAALVLQHRFAVNHRRTEVVLFVPEDFAARPLVGAHPLGLVDQAVARHPARLDQHVVLDRVTKPGAEHVALGGPELLAGLQIERNEARRGHVFALEHELRGLVAGKPVDREQLAAADGRGVVAEAVLGRRLPQDLAAVPIEHDQLPAGGVVALEALERLEHLGERAAGALVGGFFIVAVILGGTRHELGIEMRVGAGDKEVPRNSDRTPSRRIVFLGQRRQAEFAELRARGGIEADTRVVVRDVNAIRRTHVIAAARVGAGLVGEVIVKVADAGERRFPELAARIDIHRPQQIHALDDQPAVDHLWLRAVAVTRQDPLVRRAAEPEQTERRLHKLVRRDARVGGVGVLVRPVAGAGQRPIASQDPQARRRCRRRRRQLGRGLRQPLAHRQARIEAQRPAEWPQRQEGVRQEIVDGLAAEHAQVLAQHEAREIRWQHHRQRPARNNADARAIGVFACQPHPPS